MFSSVLTEVAAIREEVAGLKRDVEAIKGLLDKMSLNSFASPTISNCEADGDFQGSSVSLNVSQEESDSSSSTSNIVLIVEGKKLIVSKEILAKQSSYFNARFCGDFKHSNESEIELEDVVYEDFLALLNHMYRNDEMSYYNCEKFLPLADRFDCKRVKRDFEKHAIGYDCLDVRIKIALASKYHLGSLLNHCMMKLDRSTKIRQLMKSDEYDKLTDEIKHELQKKMVKLQKSEVNDVEFKRDEAVRRIATKMLKLRRSFCELNV